MLKAHAQHHFDQTLKILQDTFKLDTSELKDLVAHSDQLELTLARCWNRLSLAHAQISVYTNLSETNPTTVEQLNELEVLDGRIKHPNVLMAPTHLYHASSLQHEVTLLRWRLNTTFTLSLPGISGGTAASAMFTIPSVGHLSATVTQDWVSQHSSLVRNGQFMTFNLSSTHIPGLVVMDKAAQMIAVKIADHLQPGTDAKQLNKNEHAAIAGSLSANLMTGLTDSVNGSINGSGSVSREFEVGFLRSEKGEQWRMCYFQSSNIDSSSAGVNGEVGIAAGFGASLGLQTSVGSMNNVVRPPILGSAPSFHILQLPRFTQALCKLPGGSLLDDDKAVFEKLRDHDVAVMYFSRCHPRPIGVRA
ncbi:hypothetical protein [Pseudomonas zeae]|uniref:hypothetical protein n=1 Tax=Pseudomonas zeae TaxID=2745510 RepID=UPI0039E16187